MNKLFIFLASLLMLFSTTSCSAKPDYWSDMNARIEEYIWENESAKDIPASYYEICVHMMQEAQRQMNEHGDGAYFDYMWEYLDENIFGLHTISLMCSTKNDEHFISVMIGGD